MQIGYANYEKKIPFLPILFFVVFVGFTTFYLNTTKSKTVQKINYNLFSVEISLKRDNKLIKIGNGCIFSKNSQNIKILTAKHILEHANKNEFKIIFSSGKYADIQEIKFIDKNVDLAIIEVDKSFLEKIMIMKFQNSHNNSLKLIQKNSIYIWNDEYYNETERKINNFHYNKNILTTYIDGTIAPGRSGSPVFLNNTETCLGVISGYFKKDSTLGEKILCLLWVN